MAEQSDSDAMFHSDDFEASSSSGCSDNADSGSDSDGGGGKLHFPNLSHKCYLPWHTHSLHFDYIKY